MLNEALRALPADFVLDCFLDEADALQDIGDVVYSAFLYLKFIGRLI